MQKSPLARLLFIAILMVILLVPLTLIRGVVAERQSLQHEVDRTVAASYAGPQRIAGPVLVVPYVERETVTTTSDSGKKNVQVVEHARSVFFRPEQLRLDATAAVEPKYKGIYKSLVFQSRGRLTAEYAIPPNLGLKARPADITVGDAWLAMGIQDLRGIAVAPRVTWDGAAVTPAAGTRFDALGDGIHMPVGVLDASAASRHSATFDLTLGGSGQFSLAPIAGNTVVTLASSWPHPNFGGRFLPAAREVREDGFNARWEISHLAHGNGSVLARSTPGNRDGLETFDIAFIEPVNIYLRAERAAKYGILFVALTFLAFFLYESLKGLAIHPLQYGLVGCALALFFLLLLSLSEHLAFGLAYAIAASACVGLIGFYLAHVLRSRLRGIAFAGKLFLLYLVLYGLLLSEDNALVLGSLLLFGVLAGVMILTRRVDWYTLGPKDATSPSPAA